MQRIQKSSLAIIFVIAVLAVSIVAQELRRSGFLGISAAPLTDQLRRRLQPAESGILVQNVVDGGSAREAGIEPNDIITEVNTHKIADVNDFVQTVKVLRAGDEAAIKLLRGSERLTRRVPVKPRPVESAADVDTLYRAVTVGGSLRRVIVTAPKAAGRHPAILYINGIGCFSQESANLQSNDAKLLYGLSRAGLVTMRVEKSGIGDSEGPPCQSPAVDLEAERRGYVAGLNALKQYSFVDPDQVFLVGISIGGVQAPLIAAQVPVKGVVTINTVIKPFLEYLIDTRRRQNLLRRVPFDEMERRLSLNERCNHRLLIEKQTPDEIARDSPECQDFITYPAAYTYMQQWAALNPAAEWKKVAAPVLVIFGTADYVSTIADAPYMVEVLNSFHPAQATLKMIPNMDHPMNKATSMEESMNRPPTAATEFEPAVLEAIKNWLRQQSHP